ncbi:MAG: DbpA RNA binding domain-containing protein, partial [Steroidobacteraceae bacterium]
APRTDAPTKEREPERKPRAGDRERRDDAAHGRKRDRSEPPPRERSHPKETLHAKETSHPKRPPPANIPMETYRLEVGHVHGVKPGNIVGAIANEAGLEGQHIGRVDIRDDHSFVDLPEGMPKEIFRELRKVRVAGQQLQISKARKTHSPKAMPERAKDGGKRGLRR